MPRSSKFADLKDELEALRHELLPPIVEKAGEAVAGAAEAATAAAAEARPEIERVLRQLQDRISEASDEAEDVIVAHPFASVATAFLLGILVANFMSRGR